MIEEKKVSSKKKKKNFTQQKIKTIETYKLTSMQREYLKFLIIHKNIGSFRV